MWVGYKGGLVRGEKIAQYENLGHQKGKLLQTRLLQLEDATGKYIYIYGYNCVMDARQSASCCSMRGCSMIFCNVELCFWFVLRNAPHSCLCIRCNLDSYLEASLRISERCLIATFAHAPNLPKCLPLATQICSAA